ncbi:unnamed protein product [Lactuca virosa]|uniref:Vacuolar protein sorting-associated protein 13 VPS13 adaptor binding domain-containing protein n=1 Tax=Lactuca virosa TaxID=75947 RepID=A0AAU9LFW5_9ASTR|nr:unnamed protein product [Lactuca virosa]
MFITDFIKRKLESVLQPWLLQEPELELKLGFLRSHGIAKSLRFNTSALNALLDDSTGFYFTDFRIDQLTLRITNWSAPAFNWEVQGFHITISPRIVEGRGSSREPSEVLLEDKKKVLREIDPEGSELFDIMEKLANISPSRSQKTSLPKLILNYCSLQMTDINLQLQHAISDDSIACLLEIEELNAGSRLVKPQSFLRGYVNSLIVNPKESYFDLEIRGLKIRLKSHDHLSPVFSATDIICSSKLSDLQLSELNCSIEELLFSFSPADVSVLSIIVRESSRKSPSIRNGRQLWKETATRIRSLISTRKWSMQKLVGVVILWLRYVHAWENLFLLIGYYPMDIMIKRSAVKMSKNQMFSKTFRHQWEVISEIEKGIPPPAIALARRVIRCRKVNNGVSSKEEVQVNRYLEYFQKLFQLLCLIWTTLCSMFNTKRVGVLPIDSFPNLCYRLNLGKISITISPDNNTKHSVGKKAVTDRRVSLSHMDLLSFCLILDSFILLYNENICESHLTFSCGGVKVINDYEYSSKGRKKPKVLDSETVLWSKPALVFNQDRISTSLPLLETILNQTWLDWKTSCAEFGEITDETLKDPFILFEMKHFLTDQGESSLSHRFTKCCLAVGQLDFFLGYSSALSLTLLLRQIQNAFSWEKVQTSTPTFEAPLVRVWDIDSCIAEMEKELHKVIPEKLIEVGVYVVGPRIRVSLRKDSLHKAVDDIHLSFDCKNIELLVSPSLLNDSATECMHMMELQVVNMANSNNGSYQCQGQIRLDASLKIHGINAYLDDSSEVQHSKIITVKPITVQLSTLRKDNWSLGKSVSAFSAVLHGNASGISGLIFVDEMSVLVEVVNSLIFALSNTLITSNTSTSRNSNYFDTQEMLHVSSGNEMLMSSITGMPLVILTTLYILKCTSEIQSVDIIIHKSRKVNAIENQVTISESFMSQNLSANFLPDNGIQITLQKMHMKFSYKKNQGKIQGLVDFLGLRAVIFRYANDDVMNRSDLHNLLENICESSVSNCKLDLSLTNLPNESSLSHRAIGSSTSISNTCFKAKISSTELYVVGCPLKDVIIGKHESSKLEISLSIEGGFQKSISCHCQGGIIFLETTSAVMFSQCGDSYTRRIKHLFPVSHSSNITTLEASSIQETQTAGIPEDLTMHLSQFYLALIGRDESGRLEELLFSADMDLDLKVVNMKKKLSFRLPQLSILSRVLQDSIKHQNSRVQIPLRSSSTDPSFLQAALVPTNDIHSVANDASSSTSDSHIELSNEDSHQDSENYILRQLTCFIAAEEPVARDSADTSKSTQPWVGSGSISGFDVTISLSEIQMLLSIAEISGVSTKETTATVQQRQLHNEEEPMRNLEEMIQDEGEDRNYRLSGSMHYSLAPQMALFKVKYHYQKIWKSSYQWFSLTSLYAKDESGEHLQLNCNPRSNFVELSSSSNSGTSLWRSMPCKSASFEDENTIERVPLLQMSMVVPEFIIQKSHAKARVITKLVTELYSFDAKRNLWNTFLHPVEINIFWRSRVQTHGVYGVPVHLYARVKEFRVSIIELSLDILLFVIGKLDLAGPYAIQSSVILGNSCKVENQSDLVLLCQFSDKQYARIARKQSTTVFLRNLALDQHPESEASSVSIQLAERGDFLTFPIKFSLLKSGTFAWRTRIVSKNDSKAYPGPFIIVDISWKSEDGLSIVVSPILKIHNQTNFPIELRFQRPQQEETHHASLVVKAGDTIDDSTAAFDAIKASGGSKKALRSMSVGNFIFSFRPKVSEDSPSFNNMEWSDELKGGKAARLSGLFDKISYHVRNAFPLESEKSSFSTARVPSTSKTGEIDDLHFLIQSIKKDVPILQPDGSKASAVALVEQKEIFILPTVEISNLLQLEIHVVLTDKDRYFPQESENMSKQATIPCGSSVTLYANPEAMFFNVTLTAFGLTCKSVNCGDWAKKLLKQKKGNQNLDMELNFGDGRYFGLLSLSCGHRGILEAAIYTPYTLKNNTDFGLFCLAPNQNPLSRNEVEELSSQGYSKLGAFLPPKSTKSWFLRTNKVSLKLMDDKANEALLDLDAVSGVTEINLEMEEKPGLVYITKLGVSLHSSINTQTPSQVVSLSPRYVLLNESDEVITIRQCNLEDDVECMTTVSSKQRKALRLCNRTTKKRETSIFENFIRKHRNGEDDSLLFIQFSPNETGLGWSGPICVASMGRFFLKFPRSIKEKDKENEENTQEFAVVIVSEENSSLVLRFHRPPHMNLPYRVENCLRDASITYYQKGSTELETLGSGKQVNYVWDDLSLPHKLVIQISDLHLLREISVDKVREWKPLYKVSQRRALGLNFPLDKKKTGEKEFLEFVNVMTAEKLNRQFYPGAKITLRVSRFSIHFSERAKQEEESDESLVYTPIIVMRLNNISLDSMLTDQQRLNQLRVQSVSVDQKQIKYLSIVLQPFDLNLDEETLMKIVPFYRTSLSDPNTPSQQYYFDHFEIHPVKIIASFLPGDSYSSYNSTQETMRSLLHSVIKVPEIKNKTVELNGVLVTHALITIRELSVKCAQHYSWYAMRAIYIAKGSPLLPPAFASIFDDLASSSLDVFFDPSTALIKLPGLTLGTFKLLSKYIDGKGLSGTKRYLGDLGKTVKTAGSNILFVAVTEISDSVLRGAETSGFDGMFGGFQQGVLKLAMEPSVLGSAFTEGGPDRKIKLDRNPGIDELYIEGYLQAMLDTLYKHEYLRVRVIDEQVVLKNLPPNSVLIDEIMDHVKGFLISKALLKGDSSFSHPLHHLRGQNEWRIGPTILTLCEHLFVNFAIGWLREQAGDLTAKINWGDRFKGDPPKEITKEEESSKMSVLKWGVGRFVFAGMVAYIDGRLCRCIPNPVARRIVSGFVLSFLDKTRDK